MNNTLGKTSTKNYLRLCYALLFFISGSLLAQTDTAALDSLITAEDYDAAEIKLQQQISALRDKGQVDSLYRFVSYVGKITQGRSGIVDAKSKAKAYVNEIERKSSNPLTWSRAYEELDGLMVSLGDDQKALDASLKALEYGLQSPDIRALDLGRLNYAVGGNYYALYQLDRALDYFQDSARAYERSPEVKKDILADAYNGVATAQWTLNRLDSAQVNYEKAISATLESELRGYDRDYYITAFKFNLSLVIDAQGKLSDAIRMKEEIIEMLQDIIQNSDDETLVTRSKGLLGSSFTNLASFYHDTGHLTKAYQMLQYSYQKKSEVYETSHPRMAITLIQLAQSEYELKEYQRSIATTEKGLQNLKQSASSYKSLEADLMAIQAKAYAALGNNESASILFTEADKLYQEAYVSEYSREYLILMKDRAEFLSDQGDHKSAIELGLRCVNYVIKNNGDDGLPLIKEYNHLAKMYFQAGKFQNASNEANRAVALLESKLRSSESKTDSLRVEFQRPGITKIQVSSARQLETEPNEPFLLDQLDKINSAVASLERRKVTSFRNEDVRNLLEDYRGLNQLAKEILYELFELTGKETYLQSLLKTHESGIYNRIRTQFNIKNDLKFGKVPQNVLNREKFLKEALSNSLTAKDNNTIGSYFDLNRTWEGFLDSLKQQYPKYYILKYASIEQPLDNIQDFIPEEISVLRYFFIENRLFVYFITSKEQGIIPLDFERGKIKFGDLHNSRIRFEQRSRDLHLLYKVLWQPLENHITADRIIVIPDKELFNLSFELLTTSQASGPEELAELSLMTTKSIAYNYSLALLKNPARVFNYEDNYIAFAPEFTDDMKAKYKIALKDSTRLDRSYLTLLPQPFSKDLVEKYKTTFSGQAFLNTNSTKTVFKNNAGEHKIIHIGTHAESNNLSPEFSRLIFAKSSDLAAAAEDNSLFSYEIYDFDLSSNLTVLTGCETGKPAFEPGEGMISLAHAFNYAGSESILTSLWKIDEKSSSMIVGYFFDYLQQGLPKDEALRKAKLEYIAQAQGRTSQPEYWAGLVLIGDTSPLDLQSAGWPLWAWVLIILTLAIGVLIFLKKK